MANGQAITPARIFLVGFMGAGKSTIGPLLARRLSWNFVDADAYLERSIGKSIADIFLEHGEPYFRQLESAILAELAEHDQLVLALGGGIVESEENRRLMSSSANTCMIFLDAPLEVLVRRCDDSSGSGFRPLLIERECLASRYRARLPLYRQAHITVPTDGLTPEAVADLIFDRLQDTSVATRSDFGRTENDSRVG